MLITNGLQARSNTFFLTGNVCSEIKVDTENAVIVQGTVNGTYQWLAISKLKLAF